MKIVDEIIVNIKEEPERWEPTLFCLTRDDGLELWITSGRSFLQIKRPVDVYLSFIDRWRLWRIIKDYMNNHLSLEIIMKKGGKNE